MFLLLGATTMANEEAIPPSTLETSPEENFQNTILIPCSICGRTFKSESLQKHQAVCQKNASKKRRVFDSMKQRIQGTELAEYIPIPVVPPKPKLIPINKVAAKKLSKDDQRTGDSPNVGQHTNAPANTEKTPARPTVTRSNSMGVHGVARSGGAAQREERCPHCDRTFGWKAFSRHEEWCREHKSRLAQAQSPAAVLKAKEMLEARIKYRAPSLGKSKRPTNREKYAGGVYTSPAVHSVHKISVDDSPVLSSMKATVSSSNKVVSESRSRAISKSSTVQTSTAAPASVTPSKAGMGNAPRRGLSPSKKISHVIHTPWKPNINVDQGSGADENISPPGTGRNRGGRTPESDSNHGEDYDELFNRIPILECSKDSDKDEELLRWIKSVKAMLKKRNKVHLKDEDGKRAAESPISPEEAGKACHFDIKSSASDENMKRKFVYEALDSSDESSDGKVEATSGEVCSQNEEVNVLYLKETEKWVKGDDSEKGLADAPADKMETFDRAKVEAVPCIPANACVSLRGHPKELSNGSWPQVKVDETIASSVPCNCSASISLCPGSGDTDAKKGAEDFKKKGGGGVRRKSKLPVPISRFCGQSKNKMDGISKGSHNKMIIDSLSTSFIKNMSKCSSNNFNNTFILPNKSLEESYLGNQNHSGKPFPNVIEVDSLESSSSETSPRLQKGIIHSFGPELSEANIPADECIALGRNTSRREHLPGPGKHNLEESYSIPAHLLIKNNDSSYENCNAAGYSDDFNEKVRDSQENLFKSSLLQSPTEVKVEEKGLKFDCSDSAAPNRKTNDDTCQPHGNMTEKIGGVGSPDCYSSYFDGHRDSPLALEDLFTDPTVLNGDYPNSKVPREISHRNDVKLEVSASCPSIKAHYQQIVDSKEEQCLGIRLGNLEKEKVSPKSSHLGDIHSESSSVSPRSSNLETHRSTLNEKQVSPDKDILECFSEINGTKSSALNVLSVADENVKSKKRSVSNTLKRNSTSMKNKMHGIFPQGQERINDNQLLGVSLERNNPVSMGIERLNMRSCDRKNEVTSHPNEVLGGNAKAVMDEVDTNVKSNGKYLRVEKGQVRQPAKVSEEDSNSAFVQISSKGNLSFENTACEGSFMPHKALLHEHGESRECTLHTSSSSCSSLAYPCSNHSFTSNPQTVKVNSQSSMLGKCTKSPCNPLGASSKPQGLAQDCSLLLTVESSVPSSKICRRGKLRKRKCRRETSDEVRGSVQEKSKDGTPNIVNEQPLPVITTSVVLSGTSKGDMGVNETPLSHLPSLKGASDFEGNISLQENAKALATTQLKWIDLIKRLSESELHCVESVEEVVKMPDSNESFFSQRKDVVKKSSSVGLTRSDRKAAEDRVKSRLMGANWRGHPSRQELRSSPCAAHCRKGAEVTTPLGKAQPKMVTVNGKACYSIPPGLLLPPLNQKPHLSSPIQSSEEERGIGGRELTPVAPPNVRHSSYDPFSRAEMQLKELLSDGSEAPKQLIITAPPTHPEEQVTETFQNGGHEKPEKVSTKTNGNVNIHEIYAKQKQAKEVELPDLFTETSMQLNFEMPNVMRSRDRCVNTKRRALKPTAQNMGIELNAIGRDSSVGRRAAAVDHPKNIGNKFEDEEVEQITSIMDMGFCIPRMRDGNAKCNPGSELDIDSIHQSINLVALGLTNLATHSQESLADKDNNNEPGGMRGEGVDFSGNVLKEGEGGRKRESSGDSDSEGGGRRAPRRVRVRPRAVVLAGVGERDATAMVQQERGSSHESLTAIQPPLIGGGKPSVDSAYSSLNRPTFRTIEQAKEAGTKAFDHPHHGTSSEGENDHGDGWSDDEAAKRVNQNRWNAEAESSAAVKYAKFCHNCGSKYPLTEAKFCCVCGAQRLAV